MKQTGVGSFTVPPGPLLGKGGWYLCTAGLPRALVLEGRAGLRARSSCVRLSWLSRLCGFRTLPGKRKRLFPVSGGKAWRPCVHHAHRCPGSRKGAACGPLFPVGPGAHPSCRVCYPVMGLLCEDSVFVRFSVFTEIQYCTFAHHYLCLRDLTVVINVFDIKIKW